MGIARRPNGRVHAKVKVGDRCFSIGSYETEDDARVAVAAEYERLRDGTSPLLRSDCQYLLDPRVYARRIGIADGTLHRWVMEGLPIEKLSGNSRRIDPKVADAWVAQHHPDSVAFARESVLYFARRDTDSAIKIGWTSDVIRRVKEIRKEIGGDVTVVLLACVPGDKPGELALHERFAEDRIDPKEEWFRPSLKLKAFIASIGQVAA